MDTKRAADETLEDETPRKQWGDAESRGSNTTDDDTVAQRKQILTEHKVVVEQCLMVENRRTQVIATSRLQGSFVCSTNELSASTLDAGLISRFTVITPSSKRTREQPPRNCHKPKLQQTIAFNTKAPKQHGAANLDSSRPSTQGIRRPHESNKLTKMPHNKGDVGDMAI